MAGCGWKWSSRSYSRGGPSFDEAEADAGALSFAGSFPFRGGVTLIVEAPELTDGRGTRSTADLPKPKVRFSIGKAMTGASSKQREREQRKFMIAQGLAMGDTDDPTHFRANFGLLHGEY